LPTTYSILSKFLLSNLTPCLDKFIDDHQCGFRRNRSATDHTFCTHQILEDILGKNKALIQLCIDFEKGHDLYRSVVLHNILLELVTL
jgi:hypothetical protein